MLGAKKLFKKLRIYVFIGLIIFRFMIEALTVDYLFQSILVVLLWKIVRSMFKGGLSQLGYLAFSKNIKISQLKPGMVLADSIVYNIVKTNPYKNNSKCNSKLSNNANFLIDGKIKNKPDYKDNFDCERKIYTIGFCAMGKPFLDLEPEGLTYSQVKKVKKLNKKLKLSHIAVSETMPFAPFLFLGILLTILLQGNILILL